LQTQVNVGSVKHICFRICNLIFGYIENKRHLWILSKILNELFSESCQGKWPDIWQFKAKFRSDIFGSNLQTQVNVGSVKHICFRICNLIFGYIENKRHLWILSKIPNELFSESCQGKWPDIWQSKAKYRSDILWLYCCYSSMPFN
jgi:hypothetical protein